MQIPRITVQHECKIQGTAPKTAIWLHQSNDKEKKNKENKKLSKSWETVHSLSYPKALAICDIILCEQQEV